MKPSIHWLFAFIPITLLLEQVPGISPPFIFFSAALSIVPIAHLLVESTEQLAKHTGETLGGLLNCTFGNAPELIIAFTALRSGYIEMVRASIIGSILANLLLAQGCAYIYGGLKHHDQTYNASAARIYSTMMLIAVISLAIPSASANLFGESAGMESPVVRLNVQLSMLLLVTYGLYLVFMLKTHPQYFTPEQPAEEEHAEHAPWSVKKGVAFLVLASVLAAFMSEVLVGAAEGTGKALGMTQAFIGVVVLSVVGGAAESASAIAVAGKNRLDLSIGIAIGSSIQIALFVAPVLVLLSYLIVPEKPLTLAFSGLSIGFLLLSVLIGALVSSDGRANWFKGVQLIIVYVMLGMMLYFAPETTP